MTGAIGTGPGVAGRGVAGVGIGVVERTFGGVASRSGFGVAAGGLGVVGLGVVGWGVVGFGVVGFGGVGWGVVGWGGGVGRGLGFGFGTGVAPGRGVAGTVRISSRALRNCRRFSSSLMELVCWPRRFAPQTAVSARINAGTARTRRMLVYEGKVNSGKWVSGSDCALALGISQRAAYSHEL